MKIRELLQTEIWSKRTTRIAVVSAVLLFGIAPYCWVAFQQYWLTAREHSAASEALASIDELQTSESIDETQFRKRQIETKRKVAVAWQAAWTLRDHDVVNKLEAYQLDTLIARSQTHGFLVQNSPKANQVRETLMKIKLSPSQRAALIANLHETLK